MKFGALAAGLALALGLSGCATSAVDRSLAFQGTNDCLMANARRLDDHTSDAATIGKIVAANCYNAFAHELLVRAGPIPLDDFRTSFWAATPDRGTQAVLMERRGS